MFLRKRGTFVLGNNLEAWQRKYVLDVELGLCPQLLEQLYTTHPQPLF